MGRPKKSKKTYNYTKNRRKAWKKSKKLPKIICPEVKAAWDEKRSIAQNLNNMGLSADANRSIPIPTAKEMLTSAVEDKDAVVKCVQKSTRTKLKVAEDLEAQANAPRPHTLKLSEPERRYCIFMMEKYGKNYKAMARDARNYYQDTPKQIKRKISTFMSIPSQYNAYLLSKTDSQNMDTS